MSDSQNYIAESPISAKRASAARARNAEATNAEIAVWAEELAEASVTAGEAEYGPDMTSQNHSAESPDRDDWKARADAHIRAPQAAPDNIPF